MSSKSIVSALGQSVLLDSGTCRARWEEARPGAGRGHHARHLSRDLTEATLRQRFGVLVLMAVDVVTRRFVEEAFHRSLKERARLGATESLEVRLGRLEEVYGGLSLFKDALDQYDKAFKRLSQDGKGWVIRPDGTLSEVRVSVRRVQDDAIEVEPTRKPATEGAERDLYLDGKLILAKGKRSGSALTASLIVPANLWPKVRFSLRCREVSNRMRVKRRMRPRRSRSRIRARRSTASVGSWDPTFPRRTRSSSPSTLSTD